MTARDTVRRWRRTAVPAASALTAGLALAASLAVAAAHRSAGPGDATLPSSPAAAATRTPQPLTRPPAADTLPPPCHFTGTDSGGVQVRPVTRSGEDLVVFLTATDLHPCHALVHYTFSVLDPSAPGSAPLLTATGTVDRALASSRLTTPVSSAVAVAWTNWCRRPGSYTVEVTTDANIYFPEATAEAAAPGCADRGRKPTFAIIDWLNQLDALSATVDGVGVGGTIPVLLSAPTGVYAIAIDGVLFLGDPGLLGCTPTCAPTLSATLTVVSRTRARLVGDGFTVDLVACGPVPPEAQPAGF